jgi:hypothetical protein
MIEKRIASTQQQNSNLTAAMDVIKQREQQKKELSHYTLADLSDPEKAPKAIKSYGMLQKVEKKLWSLQMEVAFND